MHGFMVASVEDDDSDENITHYFLFCSHKVLQRFAQCLYSRQVVTTLSQLLTSSTAELAFFLSAPTATASAVLSSLSSARYTYDQKEGIYTLLQQ